MDEDTNEGRFEGFEASELTGRPVFDVNGRPMGHVARCHPASGRVRRFDVALLDKARKAFHEEAGIASFAASDIVSAESDIMLRDEGSFMLHPEERPTARSHDESM